MSSDKFASNSRYYGHETASLETSDGRQIVYLKRRFAPATDCFTLLQEHRIKEGERLDHLAAHYLGDPELFWVLCDANGTLRPEALIEEIGAWVRITLPKGVSGGTSNG